MVHQQPQNQISNKSFSYQCKLCERYFRFLPIINRHVVIFHKIDSDQVEEYVIINQTRKKKRYPVIIQLVKTLQTPVFQHDVNGNKSFDKYALKRQPKKNNKGHKDYKCEVCGKLFSEAGTLKKHIHIVHEGQKNFQCTVCDKSFGYSWYLKKHINIVHKELKDHKCTFCDRSFGSTSNLKYHIKNFHEKKKDLQKSRKDYKCSICGLSYVQKCSMKRHIKTIHEGKNNNHCKICDQLFGTLEYLKKHTTRDEGRKYYNKCEFCN